MAFTCSSGRKHIGPRSFAGLVLIRIQKREFTEIIGKSRVTVVCAHCCLQMLRSARPKMLHACDAPLSNPPCLSHFLPSLSPSPSPLPTLPIYPASPASCVPSRALTCLEAWKGRRRWGRWRWRGLRQPTSRNKAAVSNLQHDKGVPWLPPWHIHRSMPSRVQT